MAEIKIQCDECDEYSDDVKMQFTCLYCEEVKILKHAHELADQLLDVLVQNKTTATDGRYLLGFTSKEEKEKFIKYYKRGFESCMEYVFTYFEQYYYGGVDDVIKRFHEIQSKFKDEIIYSDIVNENDL